MNPHLAAALAEQQAIRKTPKSSEAPAPEKAAKSASKSDNQPSKEN